MTRTLLLTAALTCAAAGPAAAWPTDLDAGFGGGGKVLSHFSSNTLATASVLQPDGKIVVAGVRDLQAHRGVQLTRYDSDGSIDGGFGTGGTTTTVTQAVGGLALARQSDGMLVVATAGVVGSTSDFSMFRYQADGALDPGFGSGGVVTTDFDGGNDGANAVVVQADGRIVAAGTARIGPVLQGTDFALARYNSDGTLDPTFGTGGRVTTDFGDDNEYARAVVVLSDGRIVVADLAQGEYPIRLALARYDTSGVLDPTFGTGGTVMGPIDIDTVSSLVVQPDGKLLVGAGDGFSVVILRYENDGTPDSTFGSNGMIRPLPGPGGFTKIFVDPQEADALLLEPSGRIVALYTLTGQLVLQRFEADGTPDGSFAPCGAAATVFANRDSTSAAALLQPDGKVVAVARVCSGGDFACDVGVVRYDGSPATACRPAMAGRTSLQIRNESGDQKDSFNLKWFSPAALALTDFGDPTTTTDFTVCLVDPTGVQAFAMVATAPAGEQCGTKPCWTAKPTTYKYRNTALVPDGLTPITIASEVSGKGRVLIHGRGTHLRTPTLPLPTPVTLRMKPSDGSPCLEATFSTPETNSSLKFVANAD